jgi:quaternary ammonium compound-resistance protein SugE
MAWIILIVAGLLEVVWAYSMKISDGFTRIIPTVCTLFFVVLSFCLLSYSMKTLPLGTAYTIWAGIGVLGSFAVGILMLGESANFIRVLSAALILSGLVMMKLSNN